jgi:hypothetical protein
MGRNAEANRVMPRKKFIRCDLCYRRLTVEQDVSEKVVLQNHKLIDCQVAAKHPDYKGRKKDTTRTIGKTIDTAYFL